MVRRAAQGDASASGDNVLDAFGAVRLSVPIVRECAEISALISKHDQTMFPHLNRMKSRAFAFLLACFGLAAAAAPGRSAIVGLFEYGFNLDGAVTSGSAPSGVNLSLFDTATGLGTITMSLASPGPHFAGLYLDHEIDEATNTFFNEFGSVSGAAPAGLSWEIDEPGFVSGNIFAHFNSSNAAASALDNLVGVPSTAPDDVALAAGYRFILGLDQTAVVTYRLSTLQPPAGSFQLRHTDPASNATIYLTTGLNVTDGVIPEPATVLWGVGCALALGLRRHRRVVKSGR